MIITLGNFRSAISTWFCPMAFELIEKMARENIKLVQRATVFILNKRWGFIDAPLFLKTLKILTDTQRIAYN
ncbi:MAG: hypothetical protein P8L78_09205 [Mariniblastus sp.]|nr:hypothetical protein [Mariniblastus sp.]MDG2181855.1 hypothetical protein [Mariniblastus sp.]